MKLPHKQYLEQIIQKGYDKESKRLILSEYNQHWTDILLMRDWSMIKSVSFYDCWIFNDDIDKISVFANLNWPNLKKLTLCNLSIYQVNERIGSRGMQLLVNCRMICLQDLDLSNNQIGTPGVKYLVKINLPDLKILRLNNCGIKSEGIKNLTKSHWPSLYELNLNSSGYGILDNILQQSSWKMIQYNQFNKLKKLTIRTEIKVCLMNCAFLQQKQKIKICICCDNYKIRKSLEKSMGNIFENIFWSE